MSRDRRRGCSQLTPTTRLDFEPSLHHPGVTYAAIRAELQREAAQRARLYPKRVEAGRLTPAEAAREQALIAALLADVTRMASYAAPDAQNVTWLLEPQLQYPDCPEEARSAVSMGWKDRRHCLHRELDLRRSFYPQWIAEGRMTQPDADRQTEALDCLLARYDEGWGWPTPDHVHPTRRADFFTSEVWPTTRTAQSRTVKQEEMAL